MRTSDEPALRRAAQQAHTSQNVFQLRIDVAMTLHRSALDGVVDDRPMPSLQAGRGGEEAPARFRLSLNVSRRMPNHSVFATMASRFLVGAWILSGSRS